MDEQKSNKNPDELDANVAGRTSNGETVDFEEHLMKCMSMVIHYPEVEQIVEVIKKVYREGQR